MRRMLRLMPIVAMTAITFELHKEGRLEYHVVEHAPEGETGDEREP